MFLLILLSSCVKTYKVQTELVNQPKIKFKTEFTKLELDQVNFQKQNNNYYLTEEEMTKLTNNILKFKTYIEYIKKFTTPILMHIKKF